MATFTVGTSANVTYNLNTETMFDEETLDALQEINTRYNDIRDALRDAASEARRVAQSEIDALLQRQDEVRSLHSEAENALFNAESEERQAVKDAALGKESSDES